MMFQILLVLLTVPFLLLLTTKPTTILVAGHEDNGELSCGSAHHDLEDHEEANALMETWWQHRRRHRELQPQEEDIDESVSFVIPVCFHVIRPTNDGAENATVLDAIHLQRQLDALNRGFSSRSCCDPTQYEWCASSSSARCSLDTGFTFAMGQLNGTTGTLDRALGTRPNTTDGTPCLTRSYNDTWYDSAYGSSPIRYMQTLLRQGDATVLNVYFTDLRDPFGARNVVGGIASFPDEYGLVPQLDGIFVSIRTILPRDETETPPDTYHTIIHETGHWLGIYHVFDVSSGCDDDGDYVDDTPWQKSPSSTCDDNVLLPPKDTCPNSPGVDSIHNYMDYTRDSCSYEFTPGQVARMQAYMVLVRQGHVERDVIEATVMMTAGKDNDKIVVGTVATTPVDLGAFQTQHYRLRLGTTSDDQKFRTATITCASDGKVRLRMRKDAPPDLNLQLYDCTSAASISSSDGTCTIRHVQDQVLAVVQASGRGADKFQLKCNVTAWENVVPLTWNAAQPISLLSTVGKDVVLFRLEDLPRDDMVVSCALDRRGVARMNMEFDYRAEFLDRVLPYSQCATDGSRCTQEILVGQTAMHVVVSRLSDANDASAGEGATMTTTTNVALTCTTTPRLPDIALWDGVASPALVRLEPFGMQMYHLNIEKGSSQQVQCRASAMSGDGSLSLAWADRPQVVGPYKSEALFECRTDSFVQSCNASYFGIADIYFPVPRLYAVVEAATTAIENLSVVCTMTATFIEPIENGVVVGPMSLTARKDKVFELQVAPSAHVECVANSTSSPSSASLSSPDDDDQPGGEVDLYFRLDEPLDITHRSRANCSAETSLSYETCVLTVPHDSNSSSLFVTLLPFGGAVENVTLRCTVNNMTTMDLKTPLAAPAAPTTPVVPASTTTNRPVVTANDAPVVATSSAVQGGVPTLALLLLTLCSYYWPAQRAWRLRWYGIELFF